MAVFVKPGGGKTALSLTGLADLSAFPALVIAPINVCEHVWAQEAAQWAHLKHLTFELLRGSPAARTAALKRKADIYLINYELLPWLMAQGKWFETMRAVIFDELSMMKSTGSRRFRAVRHRLDAIPVRLGLTGTPRGNKLLNLYGELFCIASDKPFGSSYIRFRARYFHPVDREQYVWVPNAPVEETERELYAVAKKYAFSMKPAKAKYEVRSNVITVDMPRSARKIYADFLLQLMAEVGDKNLLASNERVATNKVRQVCAGGLYTNLQRTEWARLHTSKMEALANLREELEGAPLLVFYEFRHELEALRETFGDVPTIKTRGIIDAWNSGKVDLLAMHPASGAHGLNLQFGGCDLAWLTVPWSFELWTQGNGRIDRPGQTQDVTIHNIAISRTLDQEVARALARHGQGEAALMEAVAIS